MSEREDRILHSDNQNEFGRKSTGGNARGRDRKRELMAQAIQNKGAGLTKRPDPVMAERHREFMRTKKFTHGD